VNLHPIDSIGVLYVEVPKAACSSLKAALAPYRRPGPTPQGEALHRWFGYTYAFAERELDAWIARHWSGYFRFTVVRHPIERFESFFYSKVGGEDIDEFARDFAESGWARDAHAERQADLIGRDLSKYHYVGRVEDLTRTADVLSQVVGSPVRVPHLNGSIRGPGLGAEARATVAEHYREDFDLLGYTP